MADLQMDTLGAPRVVTGAEYMDALARLGWNKTNMASDLPTTTAIAGSLTSFMDQQYNQAIAQQKAQGDLAFTVARTKNIDADTDKIQQELPYNLKQLDLQNKLSQNSLDYNNQTLDSRVNQEKLKEKQLDLSVGHQQKKYDLDDTEQEQKNKVAAIALDSIKDEQTRDQAAVDDLPSALADIPNPHDLNYEDELTAYFQKHPNAVTNPKTKDQIAVRLKNNELTRSTLSSYQEQLAIQKQLFDLKSTADINSSTDVDALKQKPEEAYQRITQGNVTRTNRRISEVVGSLPSDAPPDVKAAVADLQNIQNNINDNILGQPDGIDQVRKGNKSQLLDANGNLNPKAEGELKAIETYLGDRAKKPMTAKATIYRPLAPGAPPLQPGEKRDSIDLEGTPEKIMEATQHPERYFSQTPEQRAGLEKDPQVRANESVGAILEKNPDVKALLDKANATKTPEDWKAYLDALKAKLPAQAKTPDGTSQTDQTGNRNTAFNFRPGASLTGVDSRIPEIVGAAARVLPAGYTIKPTSGVRSAGQGQHTRGKAADFQIIAPDGTPVKNRGDDDSGLYTLLARAAYGYQERVHPELTGQFQWGGQFGTSASNNEEADLMHFDIGGRRGHISRYSRENIGTTLPPGTASSIPVHASGHPAPRTPQEALTLGPGARFVDPTGTHRMVPKYA